MANIKISRKKKAPVEDESPASVLEKELQPEVNLKEDAQSELPDENDTDEEAPAETEASADDPLTDLEKKLEAAQTEARQSYDRFLRVSAEFENYKKRATREATEFRKFANESLLRELLSVVDNLERALASAKDSSTGGMGLKEGVDMTLKETLKILERFSVKQITAIGELFDPNYHQAVQQEESEDQPENTVVQEFQKGYLFHDRLLRPAMVVVSKKAGKPKS